MRKASISYPIETLRRLGATNAQLEDAEEFLAARGAYRRALIAKPQIAETIAARKYYAGALDAVQGAQLASPALRIHAAVQYVLIDGRELPFMAGAAKAALEALRDYFGKQAKQTRKAA